jgi:transposase
METRKPYPTDVSDEEWAFVAPYLTLMTPDAPQRDYDLRALAEAVQEVTGDHVELAFVDQGYTGDDTAETAKDDGIELEVVKLPEAKRGYVLLSRRWVVERNFAWAARFRGLAKDYERLPRTLIGLHLVALVCLLLQKAGPLLHVHCTL